MVSQLTVRGSSRAEGANERGDRVVGLAGGPTCVFSRRHAAVCAAGRGERSARVLDATMCALRPEGRVCATARHQCAVPLLGTRAMVPSSGTAHWCRAVAQSTGAEQCPERTARNAPPETHRPKRRVLWPSVRRAPPGLGPRTPLVGGQNTPLARARARQCTPPRPVRAFPLRRAM